MKKTLFFAAVLCGMTLYAVDPVVVWDGDFGQTEKIGIDKNTYTLSANGNSVAEDRSSITISSSVGITIDTTENLKTTGITVIYKVAKLPVDGTARALGFATKTKSDTWAGVFIDTDNKAKAVFNNAKWNDAQSHGVGSEVSVSDGVRLIAITHRSKIMEQTVSNPGTCCYIKTGLGDYETVYSYEGLMSTGGDTYGVTIGGPRAAVSGVPAATGLEIQAIAIFNEAISKDDIAAYEFPSMAQTREFTMMDTDIVIKEATTIEDDNGCSIRPVYSDPDYVDTCDSIFTVTLSALEAVEANADNDEELKGAQGGLRLVKVDEKTVKLEYLYNDESDNSTVKWGNEWPDGTKLVPVTLALDQSITVRVEFHYAKGEEGDASYVKYSIGKDYATSVTSWATTKKVTEVFIANGTKLPEKLLGRFELGKVVVDIEIDYGNEKPIEAANLTDAQAIADKMVVAISDEVAKVVDATTYRRYFKVVAKQGSDGKFHAVVEFAQSVQDEIEEKLEEAMDQVVEAFNSGSAEIVGKPGIYYGVKRGETLEAMSVMEDLQLAGADGKVKISITKPDNSKSHFYRIICSPTSTEEK